MSAEKRIVTAGLNQEQDRELVGLLSKCRIGAISPEVMTQLARIMVISVVEVVILRQRERLEALLIPRPDNDIVWPGMFHSPGTVLRASDFYREDANPLNGAFERIRDEVQGDFTAPIYAGHLYRLNKRGPDSVEVYAAELLQPSTLRRGPQWYPVEDLASYDRFIQEQLIHVNMAAAAYMRFK